MYGELLQTLKTFYNKHPGQNGGKKLANILDTFLNDERIDGDFVSAFGDVSEH